MYKKNHFHFVGINGIGMSGIAKIVYQQGHTVSGCDLSDTLTNVQELVANTCAISNKHNHDTICHDPSISIIVYSSDVPQDHPELLRARNNGITIVQRAAVLAAIMQQKYSIGVAGSHGKTTTSAMIGHMLEQANIDPTIVVGGIMHNINNNARHGTGNYVVAETDESDRSHLLLPVTIGVLTSVDFEHANVYKNLEEVIETFTLFLNKLPFYGTAIVCLDDKNTTAMLPKITSSITTYGTTADAHLQAIDIQLHPNHSTFALFDHRIGQLIGSFTLNLPSIYNVLNATAAIAVGLEIGLSYTTMRHALGSFQGVDRRFTYKGTLQHPKVNIFDDYGHHPTEIYHSLITARRKTQNKLIVVFQPQRYSRTYHLWDDFITTFASSAIDYLIITDIYSAHENPIEGITAPINISKTISFKEWSDIIEYK